MITAVRLRFSRALTSFLVFMVKKVGSWLSGLLMMEITFNFIHCNHYSENYCSFLRIPAISSKMRSRRQVASGFNQNCACLQRDFRSHAKGSAVAGRWGRADPRNGSVVALPRRMVMVRRMLLRLLLLSQMLCAAARVGAAELQTVIVDFSTSAGDLRPLHGINKGPLAGNGLIDVTGAQKSLRIPFTRLHDCHHPNPDVVDIHSVFPNPDADPALAASYDFRATDEYIAAVRATGAEVIYRLGESIEHQTVKRFVHPPRDAARWAAVCAGIVRHYNAGWANGHRYGIRYWEIWNEPENRPVMWTGDDAQFLQLYRITARTLRAEFPDIKIGGVAFGYCGKFDGTDLQPSEFCAAFLDLCRRDSLPLDFFSWHCYTDNPAELSARARAVRRLLDARGFTKTESHLNEWNYLPGNSWDILSRTAAPEARQRAAEQVSGAPGAAFLAASLIELQDAPLDVANFFHGECGMFGLFTEAGAPTRNYHAMLAFAQMLDTPKRVRTEGGPPGKLLVAAGTDAAKTRAAVLVTNLSGAEAIRLSIKHLPWPGESRTVVRIVDETRAFAVLPGMHLTDESLLLQLPPPAVALVEFSPVPATGESAPPGRER